MAMADELAPLRLRLLDIEAALQSLPPDAFGQRLDLRTEQAAIREELRSRSLAGDLLTADQLELRIAHLERQITAHYANRLSHISGPQTGYGGGIDPQILHQMHRRMDETAGIEQLKAEVRRLKDRLAAARRSNVDADWVREGPPADGAPPDR